MCFLPSLLLLQLYTSSFAPSLSPCPETSHYAMYFSIVCELLFFPFTFHYCFWFQCGRIMCFQCITRIPHPNVRANSSFFLFVCPTVSRATIFHFLFQQQTKGIESISVTIHFQCKSSIRISAHAFDASKTKKENLQKKFVQCCFSIASAQF